MPSLVSLSATVSSGGCHSVRHGKKGGLYSVASESDGAWDPGRVVSDTIGVSFFRRLVSRSFG